MMHDLSSEQREALAAHRRHWLEQQRATVPVDRQRAERAVHTAYTLAGLSPPQQIIWCEGPRQLADNWRAAVTGLDGRNQVVGRNVRQTLVDEQFSRTVAAVERACGRTLRHAVSEGMRLGRPGPLAAAVIAAALQSVDEPPLRSLWRLRWRRGARGLRAAHFGRLSFRDSGYCAHELGWVGTYQFLHEACRVTAATAPLAGLWQLAANVGWIVPHERICWLAERHHVLKFDASERLHCANGPALAYRDGTAVHMWKGVQVPSVLIESPERITARMIDREIDPVVRRCMIDIVTPARYIAMGSAVRINQDETGILWRKLWWGFDAWAAVEVVNGSPEPDGTYKHYFLQVPPTVRSAREAVAWTYGLSEHQYARLKLRT